MLISTSGRVAVIDNVRAEIEPVLTTLGKQGVPYVYFDGSLPNLPERPLRGVRFVFLDVELAGMNGQSPQNMASSVVGVLRRVVSKDNGPYVIVFWTKHREIIDTVIENCQKEGIPPVTWVDAEKQSAVDEIGKRLQDKLKDIGAFQLYVEWENTVSAATIEFVHVFSSLVNSGTDWSKDTAALFYKLYKAYVEKNDLTDKADQFKCACHLMNRSFLDTLENYTRRDLQLPTGFKLENKAITNETIAKLNTSLFLSDPIVNRHSPGNVYSYDNNTIKDSLIRDAFKDGQPPNECGLCMVIISPECDLAQNKVIMALDDEGLLHKLHRVVYGLEIPSEESGKLRNSRGSDYRIEPIWHNDKSRTLILHLATISFHSEADLPGTPLFGLQRDLFFDLLSKAASHVNRLGHFLLS